MAINKNHDFEELDGVKCAIVEKNAGGERVSFLKSLLEFNGFTVVVVPTPPPKAVPAAAKPAESEASVSSPVFGASATPATFTVGVTDYTFNPINAIFGRQLHTPDGHTVTLAYWRQQESESNDQVPYFQTGTS